MNSALKPVLPAAGGQTSPAKGNVASANHTTPALAQGTQNSVHVGNSLVGQNLSAHNNVSPAPPHAVPSMAPVTANMAQMAQNMSHHGNLSHVSQTSATPTVMAASPNKSASTSSPLSLVQDKPITPGINAPALPLALTRTPEKKEPDSTGQANGTIESPKSAANAPPTLKPPNTEVNKEKQDIAKTSPSTPKPPEKSATPATPQKAEPAPATAQADSPAPPKVAMANEAPEKSPSKPVEFKPAPTADVAPTQSDSKPAPESAKENQSQEKPSSTTSTQKEEKPVEITKKEPIPAEAKQPEVKPEPAAPALIGNKKPEPKPESTEKPDTPKKVEKEEISETPQPLSKPEEKVEEVEKKVETKSPAPAKLDKPAPKSTLKLATVTTPVRKRRQTSPSKTEGFPPAKKPELTATPSTPTTDTRTKRNRTQVQLYQSPTPELTMATKLSASAGRSTPTKPNEDKLIVIYKNEFIAVRNAEGGFYVCQAMQNVYRTTRKIKIRWLSQDKTIDPTGETYKPDFYDVIDMECVLTTLSVSRAGGGGVQLRGSEHARATSILQRALSAEHAPHHALHLTEEHPDGLDLSLYTDESQLEKKSRRRTATKRNTTDSSDSNTASPAKRSRGTPKRSPLSSQSKSPSNSTSTSTSTSSSNKNKRSPGTPPVAAPATKTATAVSEKNTPRLSGKSTPNKKTPNKPAKKDTPAATPTRKGRRTAAAKETKAPAAPVPSTSTGKATRTPRKPPTKK